jgi:hypothetical protein
MMPVEERYTLTAGVHHNGEVVKLQPGLTDTASNLYLVAANYKYVVLADSPDSIARRAGLAEFFPTMPAGWVWAVGVNILKGTPGVILVPPPKIRFDTVDQALTYIDLVVTQEDTMT